MLSAVDLNITWGNNPGYWNWTESRSEKVAELKYVCWFEISGKTNTRALSPETHYSAYIVFKKTGQCDGFEDEAIEAKVGVVGQDAKSKLIYFDSVKEGGKMREDGWLEIELGEFSTEEGRNSKEIEMSVTETKRLHWKRGLIIRGIEIRPSESQSIKRWVKSLENIL